MNRRSFFKGLGLLAIAPKVISEVAVNLSEEDKFVKSNLLPYDTYTAGTWSPYGAVQGQLVINPETNDVYVYKNKELKLLKSTLHE